MSTFNDNSYTPPAVDKFNAQNQSCRSQQKKRREYNAEAVYTNREDDEKSSLDREEKALR
ncbi:MAG: hypothetical protein OEU91_03995 [Gammaproteobacteria bacterium]|nr:hypothetical protein [Gammaproteobacteria bacterium]